MYLWELVKPVDVLRIVGAGFLTDGEITICKYTKRKVDDICSNGLELNYMCELTDFNRDTHTYRDVFAYTYTL